MDVRADCHWLITSREILTLHAICAMLLPSMLSSAPNRIYCLVSDLFYDLFIYFYYLSLNSKLRQKGNFAIANLL